MRHPRWQRDVAGQRLSPTEVTKCSVWHCEASFLANLWQLATHHAQTAHAAPRTEVWEGWKAQPARAPAWCECWLNHGHWVVELTAPSGQPAAMGQSTRWMRGGRRTGLWGGVQPVIVSASTVRSGADSTEPTRDRPFPQLRQFH
jgi:hypothetical protein